MSDLESRDAILVAEVGRAGKGSLLHCDLEARAGDGPSDGDNWGSTLIVFVNSVFIFFPDGDLHWAPWRWSLVADGGVQATGEGLGNPERTTGLLAPFAGYLERVLSEDTKGSKVG